MTWPPLSFSITSLARDLYSIHPHMGAPLESNILFPLSFVTYPDIPSLQRPRSRALCSKMADQKTLKSHLS